MKIAIVAGARPNFMKVAPILRAMKDFNRDRYPFFEPILVHTGQHYDFEMSQVFFQDLQLPQPDVHLSVGSGPHGEQTGKILIALERVLIERKPGLVMVVGDVNSTLAGALAAVKLQIPVAHVEAGLRSYDRSMPEEINRVVTDVVSDYLFTPSPEAGQNLVREGIDPKKIFEVGDVMVDSLLEGREKALRSTVLSRLGLTAQHYALLTLHRPGNVDNRETFVRLVSAIKQVSRRIPVVFPVHPRTRANILCFGIEDLFHATGIVLIEPQGYVDFLALEMNSRFVLTDSGGVQLETTVLNIPCLTLRNTTERPATVSEGTNTLVSDNANRILAEVTKILDGTYKQGRVPGPSGGKASDRITQALESKLKA